MRRSARSADAEVGAGVMTWRSARSADVEVIPQR
jgi:hypothetical protein